MLLSVSFCNCVLILLMIKLKIEVVDTMINILSE